MKPILVSVLLVGGVSFLCAADAQPGARLSQTEPSVVAPAATAVEAADSPGAVMMKTVESLRSQTRIVFKSYSGVGSASSLADWLGGPMPTNACDMLRWSRAPASGDLPIIWNAEAGRYEVSREAWQVAPSAVQRYVWYFLRAYSHLPADLRKSHSLAAVGPAAVIAADIVYPENWATLPDDVVIPAAAISALNVASPGLIAGIANGKPAKDLIAAALARVSAVGDNKTVTPDFASAEMLTSVPWERAKEGLPLKLSQIIPDHPLSLLRLQEASVNIPNVSLRLMVLAAVAQARFTLLPIGDAEKSGWKDLAEQATKWVKADLETRGASVLAPAWVPGSKSYVTTVPQSLRPLAVIILADASHEVFLEWEATGAAAAEAKLLGHSSFKNLCALAGQVPSVQMAPRPELRGQSVFLGKLSFQNLVRVEPVPGSTPFVERVVIDLIAIPPSGDGEPIRGFSADAFVLSKMPGGEPKWIPAAEVVTGIKVLGHVPMGDPAAGITTRLDTSMKPEWFTVTKVRHYKNVKGTVVIGHESGWNLATAMPQHVLLDVGKVGVWVEALKLDVGFTPYAGTGHDNKILPVSPIKTVQETEAPQWLVSLALTHESDELSRFANNVVVSRLAGGQKACATVECTSGDVSMVVETEELAAKGRRTALKDVVENPKCAPDPRATIAQAFLEKPANSPWRYAPYLKGEAYVSLKSTGPLLRAIRLVVEDVDGIGRDFLCSPNTKLRAVAASGLVVPRRAFNVKVGERLVSDFGDDGKTPKTIKVTRVEEIDIPDQRFVSLVMVNLKLTRCGPLMVEWEGRQEHMFNVGVAPDTRLALSKPVASSTARAPTEKSEAGNVSVADAAAAPAVCVAGYATPLKAIGEKLAVYDPQLRLIGSGALGKASSVTITRTLTVTAGKSELRLAGSQALIVWEKDSTFVISKAAYRLMPGDRVFVATEGSTTAVPVAIDNIVPVFACEQQVVEMAANATQGWHKNLPVRSDVCIASDIAAVIMVPGPGARIGKTIRVPDDGQPGPSSGDFNGSNAGQSPQRKTSGGGSVAELHPLPGDVLAVSEDAREQFHRRGRMVTETLDAEMAKVRSVERGGKLQVLEEAIKPGAWPYGKSPEELGTELRGWVVQALKRRGAFLSAPSWRSLPEVCLQNIVLAAWLDAAGCHETARLLARDAIEFSLFAGCSEKAATTPRMVRDGGLGIVLAASKWAESGKTETATYSVNPLATRLVKSWAAGIKMTDAAGKPLALDPPVPKDGIVELDGLFILWAIRAEAANVTWPNLNDPRDPGRADFVDWLARNSPETPTASR